MLTSQEVDQLNPMTEKYKPFVLMWGHKEVDENGKPKPEVRSDEVKKRQSVFTYKNHKGQSMTLKKIKYSFEDKSERDPETDKVTKFVEATLKREDLGGYSWDEAYERNEYERIAIAEDWPVSHLLKMLPKIPDKLQQEIEDASTARIDLEKNMRDQEEKIKAVAANYSTLFSAYSTVRQEVTAMAVEIPALKGTPFEPRYIKDLMPLASNLAKVHFPDVPDSATKPASKA